MQPEVSRALGKILCVSSVHEVIPWAGHVNYAASKGGVMLHDEEHRAGIRRRAHPGEQRGARRDPDADQPGGLGDARGLRRLCCKLIPYKRIGEPDDLARAAVWLVSDEADYVTGTTLFVDGGMTLYPGFEAGG